jgi:membrane-bound lytic murein transglycosylase D
MTPLDRYDSLFQFYAANTYVIDKGKTVLWKVRAAPMDWTLLKRQAIAESGLDPDAKSPVNAQGLSQFMAATWNEWVERKWHGRPPPNRYITPYDPEDAICAQADMMVWLLDVFEGDARKALASYNWGIGHVRTCVQVHGAFWATYLPEETSGYLAKILG